MPTTTGQCREALVRQQALHQQQQQRMARRLHDEISQQLTLLSLQLSMAQMDTNPPADWTGTCNRWSAIVRELGQNLRQIMTDLQPRVTDATGIGDALVWLAHTGCEAVQCQVHLPTAPVTISLSAANEIVSICRDVVNELFAPQGVKEATITLEEANEFVRLRMAADDKTSPLALAAPRKLNELLVHDRLYCLNGTVDVTHSGTRGMFAVTISIPSQQVAVPHAA